MDKPKYGLRKKGTTELLGVSVSSNEGADCCGENTYTLSEYEDNTWLVDFPEQAAYVARFSTPWYNADYNTPEHRFEPGELEVVKVEMKTEVVDIKAPEPAEMFEIKYKHDPNHLLYLRKQMEEHPDLHYMWGDWAEILRKEGKLK